MRIVAIGLFRLLAAAGAASFLVLAASPAARAEVPAPRLGSLETGDFSEFDQKNVYPSSSTLTTVEDRVYDGSRAARAYISAASGTKYSRLQWLDMSWVEADDVRYGAAFYLPAGFNSKAAYFSPMRWDNYIWGGDNCCTSRSGIVKWNDGYYRLIVERAGVPGQTVLVGPFSLPEERWVYLEVRQRLSVTGGVALNEVWLDGNLVGTSAKSNYYGDPVRNIRYGIVAVSDGDQEQALEVWVDRIYLGPGDSFANPPPAPQGPPLNTTPPRISGVLAKGHRVTASSGAWSEYPTAYAYQWERCDATPVCVPIEGATSSEYVLAAADVGQRMRVTVVASNELGTGAATSALTNPVARRIKKGRVRLALAGGAATLASTTAVPRHRSGRGRVLLRSDLAWLVRSAAADRRRSVTILRRDHAGAPWRRVARVRTGPRGVFRVPRRVLHTRASAPRFRAVARFRDGGTVVKVRSPVVRSLRR